MFWTLESEKSNNFESTCQRLPNKLRRALSFRHSIENSPPQFVWRHDLMPFYFRAFRDIKLIVSHGGEARFKIDLV